MANFTYPYEWNVTNVTSFSEMLRYTNYITDGVMGMFIVMIVFFVTFISLKDYETEKALAVAGFLSMIVSILLKLLLVLTWLTFGVCTVLCVAAMIGFYIYGRVYPQKPA